MKILVIEDEHKIANSIKKGFEQERYVVDVAFSGDDGYNFATTAEYDVIILDLMLPRMTGLKITSQLRSQRIQTPILILTAKDQTEDKIKGLNSGADDYLTKPFAFEELLARVKALSRRSNPKLGEIMEFADLTLDSLNYQVSRNGREIQLSAKEYALLEYLMRHPNQVLSKDQIISHIWDYDADILPNTVEVYIGYLRNKIDGSDSRHKLIKTVRGFGYKLSS